MKWVEPRIVVEVDFRGWTGGTLVRQGSLKGVREDKSAKQVVQVRPMPASVKQAASRKKISTKVSTAKASAKSGKSKSGSAKAVQVAGVALSHPDRVYWDDVGVTEMLAEYYTGCGTGLSLVIAGRVLSLVRCPGRRGAFSKNTSPPVSMTSI